MATIQPIALRISGTKARQAGFVPLINIGVLPGNEGDNMDKTTLTIEKPVFIIKHTQDYILYSLIDRQVKSYDIDTSGVLSIALTIKRGYRLANGISPYELLKEVYDLFLTTYMVRKADGRDEFINKDIYDDTPFRTLLTQYPTEEHRGTFIAMASRGITAQVRVNESTIKELFRDSQYKEFEQFREIEVGFNCPTTEALKFIKIPRPNLYSLYINGLPTNKTYTEDTGSITANAPATTTHEYTPSSFTIQELLENKSGEIIRDGALIRIDTNSNRIDCTLSKKEILYKIDHVFQSEKDKDLIAGNLGLKKIKLYLGEENITEEESVPFALTRNEPKLDPKEFDGYTAYVNKKVDHPNRKLTLAYTLQKKSAQNSIIEHSHSAYDNQETEYTPNGRNSDYQKKHKEEIKTLKNKHQKEIKEIQDQWEHKLAEEKAEAKKMSMIFIAIAFILGAGLGAGGSYLYFQTSEETGVPVDTNTNDTTGIVIASVLPTDQNSDSVISKKSEEDAASVGKDKQKSEETKVDTAALRNEVIQLVCQRSKLSDCKNHIGWKYFDRKEQTIIESILNPSQYKDKVKETGWRKLNDSIDQAKLTKWEDLKKLNLVISDIIQKYKKN